MVLTALASAPLTALRKNGCFFMKLVPLLIALAIIGTGTVLPFRFPYPLLAKLTLVLTLSPFFRNFDIPFGEEAYDAAVSVESLHHFPAELKEKLYRKLHAALKSGGCFVLTDYFAESDELETEYFQNLKQLKKEQGLPENVFFHYDTPLTVDHEIQVLQRAGFSDVQIRKEWGTTFTLLAKH